MVPFGGKPAGRKMDAAGVDDSEDFVARRKSSRRKKPSVKQVLLEESGSSDGKLNK